MLNLCNGVVASPRKDYLFYFAVIIIVITGLILIGFLGFYQMVSNHLLQAERLRDVTFPIWDTYNIKKHGFLVFLSTKDFDDAIAYSNHSSAFLMLMYFFYKIEIMFPSMPMRLLAPVTEMICIITTIIFILSHQFRLNNMRLVQYVQILLGIMFLETTPGFWISAAKYNVDNPFNFQFSLLLWVSFCISTELFDKFKFYLPLFIYAIFAPINAFLLGLYLLISSVGANCFVKDKLKLALMIMFLAGIAYIQPVLTSKILGFSSKNSTWLFRSGLDGDITYFKDAITSVIFPIAIRPVSWLIVPILILLLELLNVYMKDAVYKKRSNYARVSIPTSFYGLIFSPYLLTALMWPQAVSIHPYLYDVMLVGPISVWIIFNFNQKCFCYQGSQIWIWILLFAISFNLQQIAQSKLI